MKRRVQKIANFFAFNLLFFALYLNFIHKDKASVSSLPQNSTQNTAAFSGTVLIENPELELKKKNETANTEKATANN
jgi:hypothetical protein